MLGQLRPCAPPANRQQPLTLTVLLGAVLLFIPLVLIFQAWAYRLFGGKLDVSELIYGPRLHRITA